jgi:hypothetical protein
MALVLPVPIRYHFSPERFTKAFLTYGFGHDTGNWNMRHPGLSSASLAFAMLCGLSLNAPAKADVIIALDGVQFADGAAVLGFFGLNVSDYLSGAAITTTTGTTTTSLVGGGSRIFAGVSYSPPQQLGTDGTPPVTDFDFASAGYVFDLHLEFASPLSGGTVGIDNLVPGGGTPGAYTGSYEECLSNATACGGLTYQTARFITAGGAQVPEPASLAILGFAAAASFVGRRATRRSA